MVRRLAFRPRMVCTGCGMAGADARPNWQERRKVGAVWRWRVIAGAAAVRGLARAAL